MEYTTQKQQVIFPNINCGQPWQACILPTKLPPTAVLWQNGPLIWIYLPALPAKVLNSYFEGVAYLAQKS